MECTRILIIMLKFLEFSEVDQVVGLLQSKIDKKYIFQRGDNYYVLDTISGTAHGEGMKGRFYGNKFHFYVELQEPNFYK